MDWYIENFLDDKKEEPETEALNDLNLLDKELK